jgi:hypothetical protein
MTALLEAARETKEPGRFGFLDLCVTAPELHELMGI